MNSLEWNPLFKKICVTMTTTISILDVRKLMLPNPQISASFCFDLKCLFLYLSWMQRQKLWFYWHLVRPCLPFYKPFKFITLIHLHIYNGTGALVMVCMSVKYANWQRWGFPSHKIIHCSYILLLYRTYYTCIFRYTSWRTSIWLLWIATRRRSKKW